ncbi:MAG: hypothetical protein LBS10_09880 [Gracilibacteraceae bacterium]|jgi:hypothetical protein|nr:hypothetical protein [Gracilibacteraceae bacterium]
MKMLEDFIKLGDDERGNTMSDILHFIKYQPEDDIALSLKDMPLAGDFAGEAESLRACIAATFVQYALTERRLPLPAWLFDEKLKLKEPYIDRYCDVEGVLLAPQACLDHMVFIDRGAMEVV